MSRRTPIARPEMPSVNLLSESEFDRIRARRLRGRFVAAGVALIVLLGAAAGVQHVRVNEAHKRIAVEQAETSRLSSQTRMLAPVRAFVSGVELQQRTVDSAMADEAYVSEVLGGVRDATPLGAQLTSVAVTLTPPADPAAGTTPSSSACPGPDPYDTKVIIGCVQVSGTAGSRAEVGDMVIALDRSGLFVEPFISTTTTGDQQGVTFSGSVGLSEKAYSGRYGDAPHPGGQS